MSFVDLSQSLGVGQVFTLSTSTQFLSEEQGQLLGSGWTPVSVDTVPRQTGSQRKESEATAG